MEYNMMLLKTSFDKFMLQCIYIYLYCARKKKCYDRKKPAKKKEKENFLGRLLIADLKSNILKSARRDISAC
jgi:hypothetical protein